jgi:group I intron endonuclease
MTIKELERDLIAKGGNLSGIYKITRKSDGKVYIGQSECIVKRIMQHIDNKSETNSEKIDGAIKAEGWENFTYEVVLALPELNTEQLWLAESTYIAQEDSYNNGFNKTKGNHVGKYDHDVFVRKNVVSAEITKFIRDHFKLDYANKKVLLINLFDEQFVNVLKYYGCEVIQISKYFENQADLGNYIMEELKNYFNMKFDLIIANPPYGKPGANITKTIIDNIEYDEYINLLPANDYNRNDTKDLYKYVDLDSMTSLKGAFKDATVTTHCARINRKPHRYISWEEFEIENYIDDSLMKYFYENNNRTLVVDSVDPSGTHPDTWELDKTLLIGWRDVAHKHLPYSKTVETYSWNVLENINKTTFINDKNKQRAKAKGKYELCYFAYTFKTAIEKRNIVNFLYSDAGFKFISKVFTAENLDGGTEHHVAIALPRVDWTRAWTVEEILADYGYTQKEIDEVIADLDNFKGMED